MRETSALEPHHRFEKRLVLTGASIADFACASGDSNPLHHDLEFARNSRYGGIIASGPQTSAVLMGFVADHYSGVGPMVGLEFSFRFRAAVPAEDCVGLEWLVIRWTRTRGGESQLVELRGRLRTSAGETAVGAKGTILVNRSALAS